MARKAKGSGFKMRSGSSTSFKMMGSSPMKFGTVPVETPPSAKDKLEELKATQKDYKKEGIYSHDIIDKYHNKDLYDVVSEKDFLKQEKKNIKADIKIQKKIVKTEQKETEIKNLYDLILSEDSPRGDALRWDVARLKRLSGESGTWAELGATHHGYKVPEGSPKSGKGKIPKNILDYAHNLYKEQINIKREGTGKPEFK